MDLKKELIGGKVWVPALRRELPVTEEHKEVFLQFGHFDLFEHEPIDSEKPVKSIGPNSPRVKRSRAGK